MNLRRHLVVTFVLFAFGLLVASFVPFGVLSTHAHLRTYIDDQLADAQRVATTIERTTLERKAVVEHFTGTRNAGWLLDPEGLPIGDPTDRRAFPALVRSAPEVESARRGTIAQRTDEAPLGRRLLVAAPLIQNGRLSGVLWTSSSLAPVIQEDRETWATLGAIGAVAMAVAALVGAALSRQMTRRLEVVAAGARRFGEGHLDEPIEVKGTGEITALAKTLNEMGSEIDRLVRREKDFVTAASHQIRTPLTAIKIRIDELLAMGGAREPEETEYLKEMIDEVDRLTMLTTRLLDLSSAEMPQRSRPLIASNAVREAVERIEPLAQHFSIDVACDVLGAENVTILAPPGSFEEALFNLLDNAVKFSSPGSSVDVSARTSDGRLFVHVADRGQGIPDEQQARVLEPFYRVSRAKPGHGLGLAISARLCQSAGATLELARRENGGTVATIAWPIAHG